MGLVSALEHTSYLHPNGWLYILGPRHAYLADHYGTLNIRALLLLEYSHRPSHATSASVIMLFQTMLVQYDLCSVHRRLVLNVFP